MTTELIKGISMPPRQIVDSFDEACSRGFCSGIGDRHGQMCVEAAVCFALGLPHGDDPACVEPAIRRFKIGLNDSNWSSTAARASGLRDLGLAQIGSRDVVNGSEFVSRLALKIIRVAIPELLRLFKDAEMLKAATACESVETLDAASTASYAASDAARAASDAARAASDAARAASTASDAARAASDAARAARAASTASDAARAASDAARAARAASYAASYAASDKDYFLKLFAKLALDVLIELKSPGVSLL